MTTTSTSWPALLAILFDDPAVGRCLVAPDGTVLRANAEWLRSTGFSADLVVGEDVLALFPDGRDLAVALHAHVRAGHHVDVPRHARRVNGRETWWEGSIDPVPMEGGTGLLITAREVRGDTVARAPDDTRHADELLELGDAFCELDAAYQVVRVNARQEQLTGVPRARSVGKTHWELWPESARADSPWWREYHRCMEQRVPIEFENYYAPLDLWSHVTAYPTSAGGIAIFFRDVSARRRAEQALREMAERLRAVVAATADVVYRMSADWREMRQLQGRQFIADTDSPTTTWLEKYIPEDERPRVQAAIDEAVRNRRTFELEHRVVRADGRIGWTLSRAAPLFDAAGAIVEWIGMASDVTERKHAEELLRSREADLARAQAAAHLGSWRWDLVRDVVSWSDELFRIFGVDPSSFVPSSASTRDRVHPADRERYDRYMATALAGAAIPAFEARIVRPGGEERVVLASGVDLERDAAGKPDALFGTVLDITERKEIERELLRSEERLRVSTLAADLGVWSWVPGTSEVSVTANWRRLFGLADDAKVSFETWRDSLHPDDRERAVRALNEAVEAHRDFDTEYRVVQPDGSVRWIVDRGRGSYDAEGRPTMMAGVNIDITRRKRAEDALRDADRRKDEFLGMLSHELRNPLAPIRNALYILDRAEAGGQQAHRAKEVANRQVAHLARLVDDLLDVTRVARGKIELRRAETDLAALARRTAEDHRSMFQERGLELVVDAPDRPVILNGDEVRLAQVLGNLLSNAAKFTPARGTVTLSVATDAEHAVVHVRDTGAGIDPGLLESIFDPFTQAKQTIARSEGGLGLGLALVKGLVALHGGTVRARSGGTGTGADFLVTLPLAVPRPARQHAGEGGGGAGLAKRRRVLVVDDNRDGADTLAHLVEMFGHAARVVYDGAAALSAVRDERPDVVLCDIGLPGMDGFELARRIRALRPDGVRLVAVSGYAQPEDVARAIEAGFDAHLAKPPDPEEVAEVVGGTA